MILMSTIAMVEHNVGGTADDANLYELNDGEDGAKPRVVEERQAGTIKYFDAGSNSKLETLTNDRPSQNWREYNDRLIRQSLIGADWSYNLLVNFDGRSVADRSELAKAQKSIRQRQIILDKFASRLITWVISVAVKQGFLPDGEDKFNFTFSHQKSLSIDFGRDSKAQISLYESGLITLTEIVEESGKTFEDHVREAYEEEAKTIKIKEEIEAQYGVKIDPEKVRKTMTNKLQTT